MDRPRRRIRALLPTRRRLIQLYAALLYNAHARGFITGRIYTGRTKAVCVPGLNCYSCPGAVGACPLGALQNALASSGHRAPAYVLGTLMLFGLILGRTICGYLCPMGLIQELLHRIPTPKLRKNRVTRVLTWLKYVILAVFVFILPLWYALQDYPLPAFCKYICPAGTLEGAVGLLSNPANADAYGLLGVLFTRKYVILVLLAALCVFIYRAFCRFLCPLGAIYGLFARVAVIGVRVDLSRCDSCGRCLRKCRMDIRRVGDHECIHCGECVDVCHTKAISFRAGKWVLRGPETGAGQGAGAAGARKRRGVVPKRAAAWCAALVLLAGWFWFVNREPADEGADIAASVRSERAPGAGENIQTEAPVPEGDMGDEGAVPAAADEDTVPAAAEIPVGAVVGMRAADFTAPLYGGGSFTLSACLGRPVVINFWATWCTPCCHELPYFDQVYRACGDRVSFAMLHSNLVTDDVEKYLAGYDYQLPFGLDADGSVIRSFGGSTMLPQTVIIGADGVIVYNAPGSMTLEKLESLLALAGV